MFVMARRLVISTLRENCNKIKFSESCRMFSREPKKSNFKKPIKLALVGIGLGGIASSIYYWEIKKKKPIIPIANSSESILDQYLLQNEPPQSKPSRMITSEVDSTGLKITLYQYQTCPFCCKVRAFLDYYGFAYDIVEVNSVTRKETKWTDYKKVPFVVIEDLNEQKAYQLKDSSMIISAMYSLLANKEITLKNVALSYPITTYMEENNSIKNEVMNRYFLMYGETDPSRSKESISNERKWRRWVDDTFIHTISPNVYRTPTESLQAFEWFSEVGEWDRLFGTWERLLVIYVGATAMFFIGRMLKKRHQIKDDVRQSLYDEVNHWMKNVKARGAPFMGGEQPDLSDLNLYGALTAFEGCDAFNDLVDNTKIKSWFNKMKITVQERNGSDLVYSRGKV